MIKNYQSLIRRFGYALSVLLLLGAVVYPVLRTGKASADQLASRSITLSDSGASSNATITTGVGSGTNVTYQVKFTTFNTAASLVIDFCDENPIIGDTCTGPTGMDASAATLTTVAGESDITSAGWTIAQTASQIKLAQGGGSAAGVGTHVFELSGITNPSTVKSFYARIYTFTNTTYGTYASTAAPGNFVDYGGIALSTNQIITITARVQEQLTFCISGTIQTSWTTTNDCSDTNASTSPALTLGHGTFPATPVLDSNFVDVGTVYSQISTNATHGAVIAMRNSNTSCGGLSADNGTTCAIPAINSGSNAGASAMAAGTAAFGLFVSDSSTDVNGVGTVTPTAVYHNGSHVTVPTDVWYGMDTTTAAGADATHPQYANVKNTYGSEVATTAAPVYRVDNSYTFAATASLTTPAGIYTANIDLIATGTF